MSISQDVCRLCLGNYPCLDIFSTEHALHKKIQVCCTLQIHENDGLPAKICSGCAEFIDLAVNFRYQCEESDQILRKKLNIPLRTEKAVLKIEDPLILYDVPIVKNEEFTIKQEIVDIDDYNNFSSCEEYMKNESVDPQVETKSIDDRIKCDKVIKSEPNAKKKTLKKQDRNLSLKTKIRHKKEIDVEIVKKKKKRLATYLCPFCGMVFTRTSPFYKHVRTHNDRPFKCDTCDKGFHEKGKLLMHIKTHGEKEYPCEICGKLFKTSYDSYRHVEIVHKRARSVECAICGKRLATKFGLKMHQKTHTGEKAFECDVCKQKFTFRYTLILHMRTHTGEKPYVCRFCDAKFSVQKTLKEHERLHTGETPYCCPVCTKGFSQLSNMKSHFKNNHRGVEFNYKYVKPPML